MRIRKRRLILAIAAAVSLLASCASTGKGPQAGVSREAALESGGSITLAVLATPEIKSLYGSDPRVNPFIVKYSVIGVKSLDYLVVRLTIDTPSKLTAELVEAAAIDESGKVRTKTFDMTGFKEEAASLAPMIENQTGREGTIRWNYIPKGVFTVKSGKHSWVVVLRGSHPLPPSLTVRVRGLIDKVFQEIEIPLPDGFTS